MSCTQKKYTAAIRNFEGGDHYKNKKPQRLLATEDHSVYKKNCKNITEETMKRLYVPSSGFFAMTSIIFLFFFLFPLGAAAQTPEETLKITIIPHRSTMGNFRAYAPVVEALEKKIGIPVQMLASKTYDEAVKKLKNKEADVAYLGPFAYVKAHDDFGARLIVRTVDDDNTEFYHSLIITRKESDIKTLQDLKGKSFAFTDPNSTSGFLFPMLGLSKAGIRLEDFSRIEYLKRHVNSLLAVYNGQTDAGAVSSTAKNKVKVNFDDIRILWKSEPIYRGPWVAGKDLSDSMFQGIQTTFLEITKRKDAAEVFRKLSTKGYVKGQDSEYSNVREAIALKQKLEKQK